MEVGLRLIALWAFVSVQGYQSTGVVLYAGAIGEDNHIPGLSWEKNS